MSNIISFKNVLFSYNGEQEALHDINLNIQKGEFVAVLGYNGSGKSTLAKLINAILLPGSGKVLVDGMDTNDESLTFEIRKKVGMVFQNPDNQIVASTVEEDVAFALENLGVESSEMRRRVDSALETVGMSEYCNYAPHRLSGGQKQRVAIAGVLAMSPQCIVLDEPTAMLDPRGRKAVIDTALSLNREKGITIVLITHFMDEAALADRVVVLSGGRIAKNGPPREVFSDYDGMKQLGLGVPVAAELAQELRARGINLPRGIITPDDMVEALSPCLWRKPDERSSAGGEY